MVMIIGTPTEIKPDEYRVGIRPVGVDLLIQQGHQVLLQADAGLGAGFSDDAYQAAGAEIVDSADAVWAHADLIVKVKEPQPQEIPLPHRGLSRPRLHRHRL
jgi:alanine dehydrogenase